MRKTVKAAAVIAALLTLASCTVKQEAPKAKRTITVNGRGEVETVNDQAKIRLSVKTRNWDIKKAVEENAVKSTQVQDAIIKAGILSTDIQTEDYLLDQEKNYNSGHTVYGAYTVSNTITVTIRDVKRAGEIIDLSIKNGANNFSSLEFYASSTAKAEKEAQILAVKNAESIAKNLASTGRAKLGKILELNYGHTYTETAPLKLFESSAVSTPIKSGSSCISVDVTITYELE